MQKLIALAVLLPGLVGCALGGSETRVRIAADVVFELQAPSTYGASLVLVQAASIRVGDSSRELLFHTEITPDTIAIVGTLPSGGRLFSIVYDGQAIASDGSEELLNNVSPAYFLADLQLAQWPFAVVAAALEAANPCFAGGHCTFSETGDGLRRNLHFDGRPVINISYSGLPVYRNNIVYEHHQRAYQLQLETLEADVTQGLAP